MVIEITTPPICSYASLVDPAEGINLKYMPLVEINGQKYSKIDKTNVMSKVEHLSTAVICGVVGANPPLEVIEGFVGRIWSAKSIDKVVVARKGVFLVRFLNLQDKVEVTQRRVYFCDKKPFIV